MTRRKKAAVSAVILGFALTGHGVAQEPEADQNAGVAPVVQITAHTDQQITGAFTRDTLRVAFDSRMETPSRAILRLELADVVLNGEADFEKDTRTLDGHGHALSLDERMALVELSAELERNLNPYNQQLSPNEDFLFRVVSYWAEAPVGWQLKRRVVSRPVVNILQPLPDTSSGAAQCSSGSEPEPACFFDGSCCQECGIPCGCGGGDGITPLPCTCTSRTLTHDSLGFEANDHCFCSETLTPGCDLAADCLGRCGPGCGSTGAGIYTKDCAEHDRCCRVHGACSNPADPDCGDEFNEAGNDFLFGDTNCPNGCWCGNGVCDPGETCSSCPQDCGCSPCEQCSNGSCVPRNTCPDGSCNCGENASTCCQDCAQCCNNGDCNFPCEQCSNGSCVPRNTCPDGSCNCGENSSSCCEDCGCPSGQQCAGGSCQPTGSCCVGTSCSVTTQANCSGTWTASGTCSPNPCLCNNNGVCNAGENCSGCSNDCDPLCGDGRCECGETSSNCCDDCAECCDDAYCDDGLFCNGQERCVGGNCDPGESPCVGLGNRLCDEAEDDCCIECTDDDDCENDEVCDEDGCCIRGVEPPQCTPENPSCEQDGLFCNGEEICNTTTLECESAGSPCGTDQMCDESQDCCLASLPPICGTCGEGVSVCLVIGSFVWLALRFVNASRRRRGRGENDNRNP